MEKNRSLLLKKKYLKNKGFTLVELLAVIVILAIILVIAVPKVMSVIEDAKKATLESTAKMIASQAEKQKVQNTVLGKTDEITCESVAKISDVDYEDCDIDFDNNTAKVTITGSGKFEGLYVCEGTKTIAEAQIEQCEISSVSLPALGTSAEDCTWEEITAIGKAGKADEYFNLGDTKTINMGTYGNVVMEIVAFNADEKADGSGTAGITWLSKNFIHAYQMNSNNTSNGGWEISEMRSWLQDDVYNTFAPDVRNAIVEVNKSYFDYDFGNKTTKSCADKVWIPSYREVFGDTYRETYGVSYVDYFNSIGSCLRYDSKLAGSVRYWLRSSASDTYDSLSYCVVTAEGSFMACGLTNLEAVVIGFCTG